MVYTGPSKGCHACLKRRVKCDEAKPQCQRCQKAGRECPGYRDPSRIKIRDMTATTIHRFEYDRLTAGIKPGADGFFDQNYPHSVVALRFRGNDEYVPSQELPLSSEEQTDIERRQEAQELRCMSLRRRQDGQNGNQVASKPILRVPPRTPTRNHAVAYLINIYLDVEPQSLDPGYLDVLRLVTARQNVGKCLKSSLSTLALAAFSRRPTSRSTIVDTQASYAIALKEVNYAIGYPGSIFDDEILASIVILALVECLISDKVTGYYNHLYGAIAVLKSRGKNKFHDALGAELFMLLRYELFRTSVIRYLEPPDRYQRDWASSAMDIIYDPCLEKARAITAVSRQKRVGAVIHTVLEETVSNDQAPDPPQSFLEIPSAFLTSEIMDNVLNSDPDLAGTLKEYLRRTTDAFSLPDIPGHSTQDFQPIPTDVQLLPNTALAFPPGMQGYTWKSADHASLGISMLTSHLFGCNVAGRFVEKASAKAPAAETEEYQAMMEKSQEEIGIIVGSIPYLLTGGGRDDTADENDYMLLHNVVPLVTALESPFATTFQQEYIVDALEHSINIQGGRLTKGVLDYWRQSQRNTTSKCSSSSIRQTENCSQLVTIC